LGEEEMTTWKYQFKDYKLVLVDEPSAIVEEGPILEEDTLLAETDAEIHRLNLLIDKYQSDIYKLRKWQRVLKEPKK
jgi:hypothetical protein